MAKEKWFCLVDVKYFEEDTYVPRHNKMVLHVYDFEEALHYITGYYGENLEEVNLSWAGRTGFECKQELVFSESEFAAFETIKNIIEDDHSYDDYVKAEEAYKKHIKEITP